jgi:hypothetical protein
MADDLNDAIDSLRYMVARPGLFETLYPETTEDMLLQVLLDGMAEAQMTGLLLDHSYTDDGYISPPLSAGQTALVTLYAAVRFIRAELLNRNTSVVYAAGSARYETVQATNILRDILSALSKQKDAISAKLEQGGTASAGTAFYMADQYLARLWDSYHHAGEVAAGW